jgi:calcineurin-like phosphoesterase family protein
MIHEDQNLFFISDLHIGHKNVIKFDNRPFSDVGEMHSQMIDRWNSVVSDDDIVYFLGDLSFSRDKLTKWFIHSLRGKIYFIMGNHDSYKNISKFNRWEDIYEYGTEIKVRDENSLETRGSAGYQMIVLSHYPILSWNKSHHGAWHLHGHCHGGLNTSYQKYYERKVMDVGCNCIDYTPISYPEVRDIMNKKIISPVDEHGEY